MFVILDKETTRCPSWQQKSGKSNVLSAI